MPRYAFKALSKSNAAILGETEAESRAAVVDWLIGQGHTPLQVEERGRGAERRGTTRRVTFTPRERLQFTRELATLLEAGVTLERSLRIVSQVLERSAARAIVTQILERLRGGQNLARSLEVSPQSFPPYYLGFVSVGEASGTLLENLRRLSASLERNLAMKERMTSALLYPALLMAMTGVTFVILVTVVLPQLRPIFANTGSTLPLATRIMLAIGDGFQDYGWFIVGGVGVGALLLVEVLRAEPVRLALDRMLLSLPLLLGVVQKNETARFARTLGTLLEAGVLLPHALARTKETLSNRAMAQALSTALGAVREGAKLSVALVQTRMFPRTCLELVLVGEETGALAKMLTRAAEIYERDVETALERFITLLVPGVTIVMGLLVGGLVASVLVGIMSLNEVAL